MRFLIDTHTPIPRTRYTRAVQIAPESNPADSYTAAEYHSPTQHWWIAVHSTSHNVLEGQTLREILQQLEMAYTNEEDIL